MPIGIAMPIGESNQPERGHLVSRGEAGVRDLQPTLTGVVWQWQETVSTTGEVTLRPAEPSRYTADDEVLLDQGGQCIEDMEHTDQGTTVSPLGPDIVLANGNELGAVASEAQLRHLEDISHAAPRSSASVR